MRNASDKSCTASQNTHFIFSNFSPPNHAVYEIMWKSTVQPDKPQMTIWRMRIACWITKSTNTHLEYIIILIPFPQQQWLPERASTLRYTYIGCLVFLYGSVDSSSVDLAVLFPFTLYTPKSQYSGNHRTVRCSVLTPTSAIYHS